MRPDPLLEITEQGETTTVLTADVAAGGGGGEPDLKALYVDPPSRSLPPGAEARSEHIGTMAAPEIVRVPTQFTRETVDLCTAGFFDLPGEVAVPAVWEVDEIYVSGTHLCVDTRLDRIGRGYAYIHASWGRPSKGDYQDGLDEDHTGNFWHAGIAPADGSEQPPDDDVTLWSRDGESAVTWGEDGCPLTPKAELE